MNHFRLKKGIQRFIAVVCFVCLSMLASAQVSVTGKVIDKKENKPVAGATVQVKGTPSIGTTTDENGNFSLKVPSLNVTLEVSSVGLFTQEIKLNNRF